MKKAILTLCLLLPACCSIAFAQNISGTVTDARTGEMLEAVGVAIKGTTSGTYTDGNGIFSIPAKVGDVLVFYYLGYLDQEVKIENTQIRRCMI